MVISSRLQVTAYYYCNRAVLIVLIMKEKEEMVGRQFNNFRELEPSAGLATYVGCAKSNILIASLNRVILAS